MKNKASFLAFLEAGGVLALVSKMAPQAVLTVKVGGLGVPLPPQTLS